MGTNVAEIPKTSGKLIPNRSGWITEFDVNATNVLVKTVRLNFGKAPPYTVAVDAVQIDGPTGSAMGFRRESQQR